MSSNGILDTERPFHIEHFIQLLEQSKDPPDLLNDVAQIWVSNGDGTGMSLIDSIFAKTSPSSGI